MYLFTELNSVREILARIEDLPTTSWLYLPTTTEWTLDSASAVLQSEEVPPELEEPDAGVPQFAKDNMLKQVLPVSIIQDIVRNAKAQRPEAGLDVIFNALIYYYRRDAFIKF